MLRSSRHANRWFEPQLLEWQRELEVASGKVPELARDVATFPSAHALGPATALCPQTDLAEFRYYKSAKFSWLGDQHAGWPTPRTLDTRPPGHDALARDVESWAIVQSGHGTHMFGEGGQSGRVESEWLNEQAAAANMAEAQSEQDEELPLEVLRAKLRNIESNKARVASGGCWVYQLEQEEQEEQLTRTQKPVAVQKRHETEKGESTGEKESDTQKPAIVGSDAYKEWRRMHLNNPGV